MNGNFLRLLALIQKYGARLTQENNSWLAGEIRKKVDETVEQTRRRYSKTARRQKQKSGKRKPVQDGAMTKAEFEAEMKKAFLEDTIRTMKG